MNHIKTALAAFTIFGASSLHAQLPVSRSAAVQAVNVTASNRVFLGLPGHAEPTYRGLVTTTSVDTVNLTGTVPSVTPNTAVAMVVTGDSTIRGRYFTITSATASSVTLSGFSASGVSLSSADQIEIIPLWTLATLPVSNLTNGEEGSPTSGDLVTLISSAGLATTYYLAETSWLTEVGDVVSDNVTIPFGAAVLYTPVTTKSVTISGVSPQVKVVRESVASTRAGVSIPFGSSMTLADLESKVVAAEVGSPTSGDVLNVVIAGVLTTIYYGDDGDWHRESDDSVVPDTTVIPAGSGFIITSVDSSPLSF